MSALTPATDHLIQCLRILPGVGPKSAQRMALELLEKDPERARALAQSLLTALERVKHCERCQNLSEEPLCAVCQDERRNERVLCVTESPLDVIAIEGAGAFDGQYFVLKGRLSPLDGIGPAEIGLPLLKKRLEESPVEELILATSATAEGEATAEFIAQMIRGKEIRLTRLAQGIPSGGELGSIDRNTLGHAFSGRKVF